MNYLLIATVSLLASGLTFFSGFGLGTILLPVFAMFFPLELAISLTAIVHFLNNLFKLGITYSAANLQVVLRFGIPALVAAFFGAYVLSALSGLDPIASYELSGKTYIISPVKLVIAILIFFFSLMELVPRFNAVQFPPRYLPVGGLLSGFFGGLSGNQGALRSAFLLRAGLSKEAFIASGIMIACLIDVSRLSVYSKGFPDLSEPGLLFMLLSAILPAFLGAFLGSRLVKKITLKSLQILVSICLLLFSVVLALGIF